MPDRQVFGPARHRFPSGSRILARQTYLISNWLGAMRASVPDALAECTNQWAGESVVAWETWLPEVANVAAIKDELIRRGFVVDYRPGAGIRLAPHFYTSDDECRAVQEEMGRVSAPVWPAAGGPVG